jgi:hypothetical protein
MSTRTDRRRFLKTAAAGGAALGIGDLAFLARLRPVSAEEATLDPKTVRLRPEIEPLVRLLEETPRERLLEEVAARIKRGTSSYQEVLAALLLAGVRNVQPRPSVGHKFHAVLVVNSAHLASLGSPETDRWLPIFWALDYFKSSQAQDVREGNWTMGPVDESAVPPARKAREAFAAAMDRWDEAAADAAVTALARTQGANAVYELFFRYGARDFRSIGHKAIYVANSYRTLSCVGWQHAEPVLRSLAYALLMHEDGNPAERDAPADRPWKRNQELAGRIKEGWAGGAPDSAASADLLGTLRKGSDEDCCRQAVELLNRGVAPSSLWDALFDGAGELLMRQPGIVSLHAVTTTNALQYAYQASADDRTRKLLLLQGAAFLPLFRDAMGGRGKVGDARIDRVEPLATAESGPGAVEEIFADASRDRSSACRKALAYLQGRGEPGALIDAARRLVFIKGDDPHDYKFSSAVLEDYYHASPTWRDRYLAASLFLLPGSGDRDNQLVQRIRSALQA